MVEEPYDELTEKEQKEILESIERSKDKPMIPWKEAKEQLGLDKKMTEPFFRFITISEPQTRVCDWIDCNELALVQGSYLYYDNGFECAMTNAYLCQEHCKYIENRFKQSRKQDTPKEFNNIIKVSTGIGRLDENVPLQVFDVEDYKIVTFHFYVKEYQTFNTEDSEKYSPVIARAYIKFQDRFEILYGSGRHEAMIYPKELFSYTNSDVSECIRVVIEKTESCKWVDVEFDILKEPR